MQLRPATEADWSAIEAMAAEVVAAGEMFVYERVDEVLDYWRDPTGEVWVADLDGATAGTYVLKPNQPGRGRHVSNAGFMVRGYARGRGVGRAMGEHSLDRARALGYAAMQYNMVVETNADAVHLWRTLGFQEVARVPEAFERPDGRRVAALVMWRAL